MIPHFSSFFLFYSLVKGEERAGSRKGREGGRERRRGEEGEGMDERRV